MKIKHSLLLLFIFLIFTVIYVVDIDASSEVSREIDITRAIILEVTPPWDTIDTGVAECFIEAVDRVKADRVVLIYRVNSYGGYLDAAFTIADTLFHSSVVSIAVVENKALSAGTFIILPADYIAIQKGSIMGAMKPVIVDPVTGQVTFVNESKIIEPVLKKAEVYAQARNRNISVIREFVYEAKVLDSSSSIQYRVADVEISVFEELFKHLENRIIEKNGVKYRILINPLSAERFTCSIRSRFLSILSNPYLANVLLSIGILATIFAIASGRVVMLPITIAMALLGLIGTGFNPNLISALLIALGVVLLAVELFVIPGFGVVGVSGIVLLTIGFALLPLYVPAGALPGEEYITALRVFIFGTATTLGVFFGIVLFKVIQIRKKKPVAYTPEGKEGYAIDDIKPGSMGFVKIEGEYWRAISSKEIKTGERVVVIAIREDGVLVVDKKTT